MTREFNHSGALFHLVLYLDMIPCCSMEPKSSLKTFCTAKGTFLGGFWTGVVSFCKMILTGLILNLPIPWNKCLYLGELMIHCFVSFLETSLFYIVSWFWLVPTAAMVLTGLLLDQVLYIGAFNFMSLSASESPKPTIGLNLESTIKKGITLVLLPEDILRCQTPNFLMTCLLHAYRQTLWSIESCNLLKVTLGSIHFKTLKGSKLAQAPLSTLNLILVVQVLCGKPTCKSVKIWFDFIKHMLRHITMFLWDNINRVTFKLKIWMIINFMDTTLWLVLLLWLWPAIALLCRWTRPWGRLRSGMTKRCKLSFFATLVTLLLGSFALSRRVFVSTVATRVRWTLMWRLRSGSNPVLVFLNCHVSHLQ